MTRSRPLIAFDQSFCLAGQSHAQALRDTLHLARQCEGFGYHRFWVSEHHANGAIVGSAPEVMLGALTALTCRIRLGAAGILLPFYPPFKVAEQFQVLEALAPGRIDLGLARAPGGEPAIFSLLNPHGSSERAGFDAKVAELMHWLDGGSDSRVLPRTATRAVPWMLVTSVAGAHSAARLGLPMCFNYSAEQSRGIEAAVFAAYRAGFTPSAWLERPYTAMMFFALAAASAEQARYLFSSRALWRIRLDRGQRLPLEPPEVACPIMSDPAHAARIAGQLEINLVGDAAGVAGRIADIAGRVGTDEIGVTNWVYHLADRVDSFRLLKAASS
ncbi:MsnO8 family LLM class oxidoreductase [Herbaspirillum sp. YR522]|uniref:MsnO8 family LLM class oxidoreductase n=1 Tax=Herbaspirillum sp. YR522 TaxID=1144342 RepID=UPI00026FCDE4|nr:MsnO8 family LLM class oxidoreductase [Herbaspirillum sp. YR522]EJM95641.1 luciferase family oxidoreductase, group 1 [Herbaspirillum sp. YR522]